MFLNEIKSKRHTYSTFSSAAAPPQRGAVKVIKALDATVIGKKRPKL
jgi:hypothetical protein